jgi:hypothetical protein
VAKNCSAYSDVIYPTALFISSTKAFLSSSEAYNIDASIFSLKASPVSAFAFSSILSIEKPF